MRPHADPPHVRFAKQPFCRCMEPRSAESVEGSTMATVFFPPQARDLTQGAESVVVEGSTLRSIIHRLDEKFPGLASRLFPDGRPAPGLAVAIDGVVANRGPLSVVGPHSEVHIVAAIGGG
jgi:hypothetical protein